MAIAFIAGAVIGCMIGAALVYTYELKTLSWFGKKVDEIEQQFNQLCALTPQVAYICDGEACTSCDGEGCHHTCDIQHARNFECVGENKYMEKGESNGAL